MSRFRLDPKNLDQHPDREVYVGWDAPLQTYMIQVFDGLDANGEDYLEVNRGNDFYEITDEADVAALVSEYAELPGHLTDVLTLDRETSGNMVVDLRPQAMSTSWDQAADEAADEAADKEVDAASHEPVDDSVDQAASMDTTLGDDFGAAELPTRAAWELTDAEVHDATEIGRQNTARHDALVSGSYYADSDIVDLSSIDDLSSDQLSSDDLGSGMGY